MSYFEPIDTRLVEAVIDDLEDCNMHTLCAMLRAHYLLPGSPPQDVADEAYEEARRVIHNYRLGYRTGAEYVAVP